MDVLLVLLLVIGSLRPAFGSGSSGRLRFSRMEHEPRVYAAAPSGLLVARVRAFDVDDPNVTPFYRLLGDSLPTSDAQYFQIHAESGNLTTKRYIDRPTGSVYNVMVAAYNNGDTEYTDLAIRVTEYNKYPPHFRSQNYKGFRVDVELIAPLGTEIIKVQAVDNDPQPYNSEVYYYSQSRVVGINRTTGVISLRENLHPRNRTLTVNLLAFDGGSPRRSARSKLTINVKIVSAPRELSVEQTGDQWAMLCWLPPSSGTPLGYVIYLTSTTDFMSDRAPSVSTQRNITREELGSRGDRNCTALADLESWSDFEARIAGWDLSELGMISRAISFDTKVNNCPDNACNQGDCIVTRDPTIMYRCKCEPGYFGLRCDLYDPCYFTPCQNNGTCYNLNNSQFKCSCLAGFYGDDCSKFNPCSSTVSPCQHGGTCTSSGSNQYDCSCPPEYQGKSCEIFNPCSQTSCKNGGKCENKSSTEYGCTCPPGYTGSVCEVQVNECASSPCLNQGQCVDEVASFHCICISGFDGDLCEINVDDCEPNPCLYGGNCVDLVDGHSCNCISGRTGPACEFEVKDCASNPCKNNGTCLEDTPGYTCVCSAGFEGDTCEEDINECNSYPCLNGGSCVNGINDFRCICPPGYKGRRCDLDIDLCSDYPCQNGGTCVQYVTEKEAFYSCQCASGFSGNTCHQKERCPAESQETKKGNFTWPEIEFNTTFQLECPHGFSINSSREQVEAEQRIGKKTINKDNLDRSHKVDGRIHHKLLRNGRPFAERSCILVNNTAVWAPPRDQNCGEEGLPDPVKILKHLQELTQSPSQINATVFLDAAFQLRQILNAAIIDKKIAHSMVQIMSSIMGMNGSVMDRADKNGSVAYSLVETINSYTAQAHLPSSGPGLALTSPNLVLHIRLVEKNFASSRPGVVFAPMQVSDDSVTTNSRKQQVNIEVPQEAIRGVPSYDRVRAQFVFFRNSKLFKDKRKWRLDRVSPVLSASLANTSVANLSSPVRYLMPASGSSRGYTCVYWDPTGMQWSARGVRTNITGGWVVCEADHLTAFSVLLDPYAGRYIPPDHEAVLTAISYFGALLSITGLLLTVLTYSLFRCLNRDRSGKILLNLCISLLFMNISYLVISIKKHILVYQQDLCMVVAMLVHYFVLSSLCWMLVEAVNMYQLLITVFASSETRFILKRMLFAWGAPLCVVGGTAYCIGLEYYRFQDSEWCVFSPSMTEVYYLTYIGPATFIIFVNTVVFLMVTRVLCQRRNGIYKNGQKNEDRITAAQVRGAFTVMTLLGVTWISGVFAVGWLRLIFQYVFSIANSLQGFIIFIVRCVQYPEARRAWGRFLRTGELKSYRGGKGRSTSTRHTSSSSQSRNTGTVKGDIAWGGVRARSQQERMRELRTEIVRPRNKSSMSASFTLPRPSTAPQPMHGTMSRSRSLHLEDNSSKEGDDTSWRFIAPSAPPAPTDQGYGTAEHSPESPRQQPRRQTPAPHLSVSTPERLHSSPRHSCAGPSAHSESDVVSPSEIYPPRRDSDATTTGPTSTVTSPSATPSPSTTPTGSPSPVHVWTHIPPHKPPKRLHCEELL